MSGSSAPSAALAEVLLPVPVHRVAGQQIALRVERVRRRVLVVRRDRVEQQLAGDRDPVVAAAARADRGERAAGAVAADADLQLVEPAPPRSRVTHFVAVHAVVERRGVRMLGREPVVDRDHDAAGALRERARRAGRTPRRCRPRSRRRGSRRAPCSSRRSRPAGRSAPARRRRPRPRPSAPRRRGRTCFAKLAARLARTCSGVDSWTGGSPAASASASTFLICGSSSGTLMRSSPSQ